jgi:hypothetical protein
VTLPRPTFWLAALAATALLVAPVPAASATVAPKRCGQMTVNGRDFSVRGHRVKCRFARRGTRNFLANDIRPSGWTCRRYPRRVTRIAFTCRRGGKDFYAIRR